MASIIERIQITPEVTLVTLHHFPAQVEALATLFSRIGEDGINVDMISHTAPMGDYINVSFTLSDNQLGQMLVLAGKCRNDFPAARLEITSGHSKLTFEGQTMPTMDSVAAKVFSLLAGAKLVTKLITTSEVDISVLAESFDVEALSSLLLEQFGVTPIILGN